MRILVAVSTLFALAGVASAAENKIVDPQGNTIGIVLDCNSCKNPDKEKGCESGVRDGYHDGKRCGECLLESNYGSKVLYAYDLYVTGTLQQPDGSALSNEFVRLYLPNTWTVRTRTTEKGMFRLVLGATKAREGKPMSVELGPRTRVKKEGVADYALYMLPEPYKPCAED
jgi:hypothetical protein